MFVSLDNLVVLAHLFQANVLGLLIYVVLLSSRQDFTELTLFGQLNSMQSHLLHGTLH